MKKILSAFIVFALTALSLWGAEPSAASAISAVSAGRVRVTFADKTVYVTLNNSPTARDLYARLPLSLDGVEYNNMEKYAYLPQKLDTGGAPDGTAPVKGNFLYHGGLTALSLFYRDFEYTEKMVLLGNIEDGGEAVLAATRGNGTLRLEKAAATAVNGVTNPSAVGGPSVTGKKLVVYYSLSGVTERAAKTISKKTGADIANLEPLQAYTGTSADVSNRSKRELEQGPLPVLRQNLPSLQKYDTILIGAPVWSGGVPAPLATYLAGADFSGKTVAYFWTDMGTPGQYEADARARTKNASTIAQGLRLPYAARMSLGELETALNGWLSALGLL